MKRKDLRKLLTKDASHRCFRGNSIWCVINKEITFYDTWENETGWEAQEEKEGHFSQDNCPVKYLKEAPEIDPEWRIRVKEFLQKMRDTKTRMREVFNSCTGDEKVRVTLERKGYILTPNELIVIEVHSEYIGRAESGMAYHIPPRLVKDIQKINIDKQQ